MGAEMHYVRPGDTVTLNPEREIAVPTGIKPGAENQRLAA
ncbi:hypothetical protein RR42_m0030 [Cupriavidus basilensis]|uniref:Uncharacterized protein n=1 Tax=Cupriavidus basilensis TaxID=68895 RepID=A0A0C4Y3K6_9BURK|nr:hypothetical protein RR42_m0030 [Cupriavidus basilensis]